MYDEMLEEFNQEANELLTQAESGLIQIDKGEDIQMSFDEVYRCLHSLKGSAGMFGLEELKNHFHHLENIFDMANKEDQLSASLIDYLLKGLDSAKQNLIGEDLSFEIKELQEIVQNHTNTETGTSKIKTENHSNLKQENSKKEYESTNEFFKQFKDTNETKYFESHTEAPPIHEQNEKPLPQPNKTSEPMDSINIPMNVLDHFMELSSEVTIFRNSITKSFESVQNLLPNNENLTTMADALTEMHKTIDLIQSQIMDIRKVNLSNILQPFYEIVKKVEKEKNKNVNLSIEGEQVRVDNQLANFLTDTLGEIIRNSIEHGIETTEERLSANKGVKGTVSLSFAEEAESLRVIIRDDGKGLDPNIIKNKAIEKKLYSQKELERMPLQRIYEIIFEPDFSTNNTVTNTSCRGSGMDMVKRSIAQEGGKIKIESETSKGTTFTISIPYPKSILIINGLQVKSNNESYVIPTDDIQDVRQLDGEDLKKIRKVKFTPVLDDSEGLIPIIILSDVLNNKEPPEGSLKRLINSRKQLNFVTVKANKKKCAILVDEILDMEETVKRKLCHSIYQQTNIYSGASVLGSKEVSLIIDVEELAKRVHLEDEKPKNLETLSDKAPRDEKTTKEYINVKIGKTNTYVIPLEFVHRFESIETSKIDFSGDVPLIKYGNKALRLIHLEKEIEGSEESAQDVLKNPSINLVVVEDEGGMLGLIVDSILDPVTTTSDIFTHNVDRDSFKGTTFIGQRTYTIIDIKKLSPKRTKSRTNLSHYTQKAA